MIWHWRNNWRTSSTEQNTAVKLCFSWPSWFVRLSFNALGGLLVFISSFHIFVYFHKPSIWLGSRVTTSPLRLRTAHGFECCWTSIDASCINEVSIERADTSAKVLLRIWLITKQDKSHTFPGFQSINYHSFSVLNYSNAIIIGSSLSNLLSTS